jgi:hypothetical protein
MESSTTTGCFGALTAAVGATCCTNNWAPSETPGLTGAYREHCGGCGDLTPCHGVCDPMCNPASMGQQCQECIAEQILMSACPALIPVCLDGGTFGPREGGPPDGARMDVRPVAPTQCVGYATCLQNCGYP